MKCQLKKYPLLSAQKIYLGFYHCYYCNYYKQHHNIYKCQYYYCHYKNQSLLKTMVT